MREIFENYREFEFVKEEIEAGEGEYIGEGSESTVWRVNRESGTYAVKVINPLSLSPRGRPRSVPLVAKMKVEAGIRGQGVEGLEQIRAASLEDGVVIWDYAQGIKEFDAATIPDSQIGALMATICTATSLGLQFDGCNRSGGNAIYSPDRGFTLIDYDVTVDNRLSVKENTKYALRSLGAAGVVLAGKLGEDI